MKDTHIIDDINYNYICIYFINLIDEKYIPSTIYINRYNGKIKNKFNDCISINNIDFTKFINLNIIKIFLDFFIPLNIQTT